MNNLTKKDKDLIRFSHEKLQDSMAGKWRDEEFANLLNTITFGKMKASRQLVHSWRTGKSIPSAKWLYHIRVALGLKRIDDLYDEVPN